MTARRIAIVTGASHGIGFETAVGMAAVDYHVIMACRSRDRAVAAKIAILKRVSEASLDIFPIDRGDLL